MNSNERRLRRLEAAKSAPARRILIYGPAGMSQQTIADCCATKGIERRDSDEITVIVHMFGAVEGSQPSLLAVDW